MNEPMGAPTIEAPANKNRTWIIVAVVLVVLCCCCIAGAVALYFGYDSLGDPLGIYGMLPALGKPV